MSDRECAGCGHEPHVGHCKGVLIDLGGEYVAEGRDPQEPCACVWREKSREAYVVIYDEGPRGSEREQYYGFFSSIERAKSQYAALNDGRYHHAKVCLVVEELPDLEKRLHDDRGQIRGTVETKALRDHFYPEMADEDLIADAAMEAENRWQNGRRDPESWRERGQEADEPSPTAAVEDGRIILYAEGVRFDLTDDAQKVIWALCQLPGPGSLARVRRAAQDIGNEFGWFDQRPSNNDGYGFAGDGVSGRTGDPDDDLASTDRLEARTASFDRLYGESSPKNPNPRCKECGERLKASPRAEVYLDATTMRRNAGGQDVLVDEIPESAFGPYLVHQESCYLSNGPEGTRKYVLA